MNTFNNFRKRLQLNESVVLYSDRADFNTPTKQQKNVENQNSLMTNFYDSAKTNQNKSFKLEDGSVVEITPLEAKNVIYTFEELNGDNQGIFESFLQKDINSYSMMIEFTNEYCE